MEPYLWRIGKRVLNRKMEKSLEERNSPFSPPMLVPSILSFVRLIRMTAVPRVKITIVTKNSYTRSPIGLSLPSSLPVLSSFSPSQLSSLGGGRLHRAEHCTRHGMHYGTRGQRFYRKNCGHARRTRSAPRRLPCPRRYVPKHRPTSRSRRRRLLSCIASVPHGCVHTLRLLSISERERGRYNADPLSC